MNPYIPKLIQAIQSNRKIEAAEAFQHVMTQKAIEKLEKFKQETGARMFKKGAN